MASLATALSQGRCTRWKGVLAPALHGGISALAATSASDLWAIGTVGVGFAPISMHWDGSIWTQVSVATVGTFDVLRGVTAVSSTDVWAAGSFDAIDGIH